MSSAATNYTNNDFLFCGVFEIDCLFWCRLRNADCLGGGLPLLVVVDDYSIEGLMEGTLWNGDNTIILIVTQLAIVFLNTPWVSKNDFVSIDSKDGIFM